MDKKYEVLVFDFDYTLFDYEATEQVAIKAAFEKLNLPYEDRYWAMFKRINRRIWADSDRDRRIDKTALRIERFRLLFDQLGIEDAEGRAHEASEAYITASEYGVLIEGVQDTILQLADRYSLAIASSGLSSPRIEKLRNSPISDAFDVTMFREQFDEDSIKPHHNFFDKIAANYRVSREKILFIGDSMREDIQGAKNAGFSTVFFNYFHLPEREIDFDSCDYIIDKFNELISVVKL